jgi:2-dehydro-3-deoxyglucarate aldolase/4-hydroxy-2-oxoheptanedioate aldolase
MNTLRDKLKKGSTLGVLVSNNSADMVEVLSMTGLDWLMVDLEHAAIDAQNFQALCRAASGRCSVIARVPKNDSIWISRVLDAGADGIIVPQVNSADDAKLVVQHAKYAPIGKRGIGLGRAQGFGAQFKEYIETANDRILVAVQIEHIDAVYTVDAIASVPGIDALFVGPYDLSDSLQLRGEIHHPRVTEAIAETKRVCDAKHLPIGIFCSDVEAASLRMKEGFRLLAVGTDFTLLRAKVQEVLTSLNEQN